MGEYISPRRCACTNAVLNLVAEPAGPDGQGIRRDLQPGRQLAPLLDPGPLVAPIVVDDEGAIRRRQFVEAAVEAVEQLLRGRLAGITSLWRDRRLPRGCQTVEARLTMLGPPEVLQEHESGDDVAVACGHGIGHRALFLEPPRHAVQRIVREFVRPEAPLPPEILHQTPAHLEVPFAAGVDAGVQPGEQSIERALIRGPVSIRVSVCYLLSLRVLSAILHGTAARASQAGPERPAHISDHAEARP